ncbi:hypothetical protein [Burkholderia savannae]|uniref:hypothetical protein n=1 Tax=Burkholderia TaxID=32008 RepID=UPI0007562036|nr:MULTISPECIES: hypothetical protein [unclassified Burkholderia]AOJ71307.1 hypothetical protein WS78_20905 [Burkholderia savannae]KVG40353.1 hypothetical protein WS77_18995 [Burkholderia sp. MSMB0265]KVG78559.1 hypothetical protein WS81_15400 [Burkholderia sp. MSMB2040]KVG92283.1 hypothetical protein WS83_11880 [Burkholderia sp. MSMB2042]KVH01590.1 hypothetical protein WS82_21630 [Burkholderia sp. MSMB2041]
MNWHIDFNDEQWRGYVSDGQCRRGWSAAAARKTCLVVGMLLSPTIALPAIVERARACFARFALAYAGAAADRGCRLPGPSERRGRRGRRVMTTSAAVCA